LNNSRNSHFREKRLIALLSRVTDLDVDEVQDKVKENLDWDYIFETACQLGVAPLLYFHIRDLKPASLQDNPIRDAFQEQYHVTLAKNLYLTKEFDVITGKLSELGIPCIGLKGALFARSIYPSPALRPMCDMDILVRPKDLHGVGEAVQSLGYRTFGKASVLEKKKYQYHTHYHKESGAPILLEVHWALGQKNRYRIKDADIWARARKSPAGPFLEMSDDDTLIYLSLHYFKHFLFKRLIWLCDIHECIKHKEVHWDTVIDRARDQSIATFVAYTLLLFESFYRTRLPVAFDDILEIGTVRRNILDRYVRRYDLFHPVTQKIWPIRRLFAFSCMDRMSDRIRFSWDAIRRDLD
jgi:hypothetical protein